MISLMLLFWIIDHKIFMSNVNSKMYHLSPQIVSVYCLLLGIIFLHTWYSKNQKHNHENRFIIIDKLRKNHTIIENNIFM